ncbi:MAG TPA: DinB family protein [Longimicrobiales bacterium]|nr:DinB family protein [Longimicrobiales bacterium]
MSTAESRPATSKAVFLRVYDREHATTMKVLRAYPAERLDLQPHPKCRTARELAWVFVVERGLGMAVYENRLQELMQGEMPEPPESWDELLTAYATSHEQFRSMIEATPDDELQHKVSFFTGPQQMGEMTRMEWLWFLLHDEIHHRGQFSVYLRMADAAVPSIYGPTADEPWM